MGVSCRLTDRRRLVRAASNAGHRFSSPIQLFPAPSARRAGWSNQCAGTAIHWSLRGILRSHDTSRARNEFFSRRNSRSGCKAKRVSFVNLLDISNVHIGDEGRGVGFCLVVVRKLEKFQHGVRRVIECQDIERNVHVPIVIDPFRSNRFFVEREWCWNIFGVHRAKLWLGSSR